MAKSIFTVLQDFEKLVYKILMWVILIPKTIVAVVLDPIWFREYVKGEERMNRHLMNIFPRSFYCWSLRSCQHWHLIFCRPMGL